MQKTLLIFMLLIFVLSCGDINKSKPVPVSLNIKKAAGTDIFSSTTVKLFTLKVTAGRKNYEFTISNREFEVRLDKVPVGLVPFYVSVYYGNTCVATGSAIAKVNSNINIVNIDLYPIPNLKLSASKNPEFSAGGPVYGLTFDTGFQFLYVLTSSKITRYDTTAFSNHGSINITSFCTEPSGITFDSSNILITDSVSMKILSISPSDGSHDSNVDITLNHNPTAIAYDYYKFWLSTKINKNGWLGCYNNSFRTIITGPFNINHTVPSELVITEPELYNQNYLAGVQSDSLYFLDKANGNIIKSYLLPINNTTGIAWDGSNFWISNISGDIYKISLLEGIPPLIKHTQKFFASKNNDLEIKAYVYDNDAVKSVTLHYYAGFIVFKQTVNMTASSTEDYLYTGAIPSAYFQSYDELYYYIEAEDSSGNISYFGGSGLSNVIGSNYIKVILITK